MSRAVIFSLYLQERMHAKKMNVAELSGELNFRTLIPVGSWYNGSRLPLGFELYDLARVLEADPVVMAVAWLIAVCPALEDIMRREVLSGRSEHVPELL